MAEPTPESTPESTPGANSTEGKLASDATQENVGKPAGAAGEGGEEGEKKPDAKAAAAAKATAAKKAIQERLKKLSVGIPNPKHALIALGKTIIEIPALIVNGDTLTRVILGGFAASLVLLLVTGRMLYDRFGPKLKFSHHVVRNLEEEKVDEQKKLQILAEDAVFLQHFDGTLTVKAGESAGESQQPFEVELYVEADSPDTAKTIKAHLPDVRDMVVSANQGLVYEQLLTEEGKAAWRRQIAATIEKGIKRWAPEGKIKRVYFTHLVLDASLR